MCMYIPIENNTIVPFMFIVTHNYVQYNTILQPAR